MCHLFACLSMMMCPLPLRPAKFTLVLRLSAVSVCLAFWYALATSSVAVGRAWFAATFVSASFACGILIAHACLRYSAVSLVVLGRLLRLCRPRLFVLTRFHVQTNT